MFHTLGDCTQVAATFPNGKPKAKIVRKTGGNIPACLTVVRTLSRGLEKEPLVLEVLFGGGGVGDCM